MAKRVRYAGRPKRAPSRRPSGSPGQPLAPRPVEPVAPIDESLVEDQIDRPAAGHLTDAEIRRAEALQAEMAAQEKAALADAIKRRARARAGEVDVDDINAPLKVKAANEYAYVARDLRRIALTGGLMVAILAVLAILVNVAGVVRF